MLDQYKDNILKWSIQFGIDFNLICAIILTESSGNPWVCRVEPTWKYFYHVRDFADLLGITYDTETMQQCTSWGLMQVMGSVTRELGYKDLLTKLVEPELSIQYGCKKIKQLQQKYTLEADVVSAYNAGSIIKNTSGVYLNERYVDKVYSRLREFRSLK